MATEHLKYMASQTETSCKCKIQIGFSKNKIEQNKTSLIITVFFYYMLKTY